MILFPFVIHAQPDSLWSNFYGGRHRDQGSAIIQTEDGGYAIAGTIITRTEFDNLRDEGAFLKIDSEGDEEFIQLFGGNSSDNFWDLIQLNDRGYLLVGSNASIGHGNEEGWIIRTDEDGEEIWSRTFGGEWLDSFTSVKAIADDEYVLAGITSDDGNQEIWLASINSEGELLWSETYGTESRDHCSDFVFDDDGGYILCGSTYPERNGIKDGYVIKLNSDREEVWSQTIGTDEQENFLGVVKTPEGCALAGYTGMFVHAGNIDFYLVNLDHDGEILWENTYGGGTHELAYSLVQTSEGGFMMGGFTHSYGNGMSDFYIVRTDPDGNQLWDDVYGGGGGEDCFDVANCSDGGYALTGKTSTFRREGMILDNIWIVKTGTDILRMLSMPDTSFEQDDTLKLDITWFTQFVVPEVYLDSALTIEIEPGDLIQTAFENDTLLLWSDQLGIDSLLIRFFEDDNEDNVDESWLTVSVVEPNSINDEAVFPGDFALLNAYPNPFNSSTRIAYDLNDRMDVEVSVFNSLGQRINVLDHGQKNAGSYNLTWDVQNTPSGTYFIKLKTPNLTQESRVLLIK